MHRHRISLAVFFVVVLALWFLVPREPAYRDRSLTSWLPDLVEKDFQTYYRAADAIRALGPRAVPPLLELLHREDGHLRQWTQFFREELVPGQQTHPDWQYRGWASLALGELGPRAREAVPDLKTAANKGNAFESACARAALIKIRKCPIDPLIDILKNPDSPDWHRAMYVLRFLRKDAEKAIPVLIDLLDKLPGEDHRAARISILDVLGYAACSPEITIPALWKFADSENPNERARALDSLKNFRARSDELHPDNPSLAQK